MIIELDRIEAYRLLLLMECKAITSLDPMWKRSWANLARKIKQSLDAQASGKFFQCSACTDEPQDEILQYSRDDPAA